MNIGHWKRLGCFFLTTIALTAQTWTAGRLGLDGVGQPRSIAYGNGRFVASFTPANNTTSVAYSDDGTTWNYAEGNNFGVGGTVGFRDNAFYYTSGSSAYRSEDGAAWTRISTIPGGNFASAEGAATNGTTYLFGSVSSGQPSPLITDDFINWSYASPLPTSAPYTEVSGYRLAYGAGRFVIFYSASTPDSHLPTDKEASSADNGATWTEISGGLQPYPEAIAFGNGRFVAFGYNRIYTSTDGLNFETHTNLGGLPLGTQNVAFVGGRFLAYNNATFYASTDGLNWSSFGSVAPEYAQSYIHLTYGKGRYVGFTRRFVPSGPAYEDVLLVAAGLAPPQISLQPQDTTAPIGTATSLSVKVEDPTGISYTWFKNNAVIPGATAATLAFATVADSDAGTYHCVLTNNQGSATTATAVLTIGDPLVAGRLVNLSVLTRSGTGAEVLTAGFVLGGTGTKPVLIRGIGPGLIQHGVTGTVGDPYLTLHANGAVLAENDNWTGYAGADLGAFPLIPGSADAVITYDVGPGLHTALVADTSGEIGNAQIEVYDGDSDNDTLQLRNLSARVQLPVGRSVTAGFVIGGDTPLTVVVRAAGPGLAQYLSGTLANPKLTLFRGDTVIAENSDWSGDDGSALGAFPLEPGSLDSALTATLEAGLYSARAESEQTGDSGIVLLEIYVVP